MTSFDSYLPSWRDAGRVLAIAVLYYVGAHLGYAASFVNAPVNPIWPPSGISLALLLIVGVRYWPGVAVGAFFANLVNVPWDAALFISIGAALESVVSVTLLHRVSGFDPKLGRQSDIFSFLVIGCVIGPAVAAVWGATGLVLWGIVPGGAFANTWLTWWIGDAIGVLSVTPMILAWKYGREKSTERSWHHVLEGTALLIAPFVIEFSLHRTFDHPHFFFPFIIWSALRFRILGAANASFLMAAISIGAVRTQPILAAAGDVNVILMNLVGLLAATGATGLILAAIVTERDTSERTLRNSHDELERQVADRTTRLFEMNARLQRELSERTAEQIENRRRARIFDQAEWGIVVTRIEGARIEMMNAAYARMHGYSREEMASMEVAALYAPETRADVPRQLARIQELGHHTYETLHMRKDGTVFPVMVDASIDRDENGEPTHYLVYVQDISERKRVEEVLEESERRFRDILGNVRLFSLMLDQEGNVTFMNDHALTSLGYAAEEVIGANWFERFVPDPKAVEVFREAFNSGELPTHFENEITAKNGDRRLIRWSNTMLRDPHGTLMGAASIGEDVTDQKRAEEEQRLHQTRTASLLTIMQRQASSVQQWLDFALEEAIKLTQSKIGYIYFYSEEQKRFVLNSWSKDVMADCRIQDPQTCYELEKTGIWGEAVRQRRPIMLNDFAATNPLKKGYPEGHAPLRKYLTIPVFAGEQIVAVVGVANKETDYDETDITQLSLLMNSVWKEADRKRAEEALRESEERFRTLFELANDAILVMRDSVFVQCNPQALEIFRCRREDIIGRSPVDFSPPTQPDGSNSSEKSLDRIAMAASGTPQRFEWVHTRSDGTPFFTDVSLNQVFLGRDLHVQAVVRDISRRKKAEEEMRRTNQLLTDVLSSSSEVSIIATDAQGIITVFNRGAERMLGYTAKEMVGTRTPEAIHVGMEALARGRELSVQFGEPVEGCDVFFKIARIEGSESREWNYLRKNGTSFPASVVVTPMKSANGAIIGYLSIAQDVTERKNAERELREKKEELDRFFGVAVDLFCIADTEGRFLRLNQQWHHTLGFEVEEMIGMPFMNLVHPEDVPATIEVTKDLAGGKDVMNFVNRYRRIDGHYRWLEWRSATLNGIIYAAARDITEQRYAQLELEFHAEELQRTSKELDQFFNVSADLLCITDLHGRFHRLNRQWARLLGFSLHELQELSLRDLVHPEDRAEHDASFKHLKTAGEVLNFICRFRTREGEDRWLEWHSVLVEEFVYAGARDITERIEAERKLAERANDLARSNQELEQFAYVASHDLQEPLRMISSYTQLLSKRYSGKLDADADEFIQYAVSGAVRMQALIKSLLTYSRVTRDRTPAEPVNLEEVLSDVRLNLKVALEESGGIVTNDPLPTVHGNRMQLVQVFQNLIGNALKFRGDRPPRVHVGGCQKDGAWQFTVQDNGIGIDPQFFERIFVIFQRLHTIQQYDGTGIGLAVCKKIIEQHGGRISVASEKGSGTTFTFTISDGER